MDRISKLNNNTILGILGVVGFVALVILAWSGYSFWIKMQYPEVYSFEDCKKYYPVQESFPMRCTSHSGQTFIDKSDIENFEITGRIVCLPHKNKGDVQTLECALGLKNADQYFRLKYDNANDSLGGYPMDRDLAIKGSLTTVIDQNEKYDISGNITIKEIKY